MKAEDAKRLKRLEVGTARQERIVADQVLQVQALCVLSEGDREGNSCVGGTDAKRSECCGR